MDLSEKGLDVVAVDNYFRRNAMAELGCESLIPTPDLHGRVSAWKEVSGLNISLETCDITDYAFLLDVFRRHSPDAVVHYAEQPSAPYSMMDRDKAAFTVSNNLIGTLNIAYAVKEVNPACHIVKLGTMGEYGTPNIDIEEGWLEIEHKGRTDKFLFPRQGGSLYHTTKIQDTDMLWFYVRMWGLSVTDLMQGPVYGLSTEQTDRDERLMTIFNYDDVFGTVFNRFLVQSLAGHPLTVYGKGGQTRGYLDLRDTLQCVYLALSKPAPKGEMRIFNQVTEIFSVNDLAARIKTVGDRLGLGVEIRQMQNPRVELESHYYNPSYTGLKDLGLKPHYLTDEVIERFFGILQRYRHRINRDAIFRGVSWK